MNNEFLRNFYPSFASTVVGGLVLAFIFFLASDIFFSPENLNGLWTMHVTIEESEYKEYVDLKLQFIVVLEHYDDKLSGIAEKEMATYRDGKKEVYGGHDRTISNIQGHIDRKYLFDDAASVHFTEKGKRRTSATIQSLKIHDETWMSGRFYSTVSRASGLVEWKKTI